MLCGKAKSSGPVLQALRKVLALSTVLCGKAKSGGPVLQALRKVLALSTVAGWVAASKLGANVFCCGVFRLPVCYLQI